MHDLWHNNFADPPAMAATTGFMQLEGEEVLRQRQKAAVSDSAIGEALSELGYGHLFQLRLWRGRSLLEEGVRVLSDRNPRPGFLIRVRRKLAAAYALTGHPKRAREELQAARDLARVHGVFDQIR